MQVGESTNVGANYTLLLNPNGGNIGIGTNSPAEALTVVGTIRVQSASGDTDGLHISSDSNGDALINAGYSVSDLKFATADVERMRITDGGNVAMGNGTQAINNDAILTLRTTAFAGLDIQSSRSAGNNLGGIRVFHTASTTTPVAQFLIEDDGSYNFYNGSNGAVNRMRITSGGNIEQGTVGTTASAYYYFNATTSGDTGIIFRDNASTNSGFLTYNHDIDSMKFATGGSERMRISSDGYLNAGAYTTASNTHHKIVTTRTNSETLRVENNSTSPYGQIIRYGGATPNTTDNWFLVCEDQSFSRLIIWSNGNVVNRNNSYGALSDAKLKENIVNATPKLDDLMKVKVRNYNLIGDDKKQIGVVAQELEEVFPNMIDESIDFEDKEVTDEDGNVKIEKIDLGTTTKSVKYSVFVPMLIKSIQELKAEVDKLKQECKCKN